MPTVVPPGSIDDTGATDAGADLTAWVETLGPGTTIEFPAPAIYRCDTSFEIVDKDGLILHGNGCTFNRVDAPGQTGPLLSITGGDGLEIADLTIVGANPNGGVNGDYVVAKESHHCLWLSGVENFSVHDCEFRNPFGDCTYFDARKVGPAGVESSYFWCHDGVYERNKVHHSGRQLLTLQGVRDLEITDCDVYEARRSMVEIEPHGLAFNGVDMINIHHNRFGAGRFAMITNTGSGPCDNVTFADNVYARNPVVTAIDGGADDVDPPIAPGRRTGWRILNNRFVTLATDSPEVPVPAVCQHHGSPSGSVMDFTRYDDLEVVGNEAFIDDNRDPSMVFCQLTDCLNYSVHDNDVTLVIGGDGPGQCTVVGPGEELRTFDVPPEPVTPWVPGADWSFLIAAAMLEAAVSCEAVCDRRWVSDGSYPEQPPPGCPCQLVAVVVEGLQATTDPEVCGTGRFAQIRLVLDLCTEPTPGPDAIPDPVAINTRAAANASTRWLMMTGLQRAAALGLLTVLDGLSLFAATWQITEDHWHQTRGTTGLARYETTWRFTEGT